MRRGRAWPPRVLGQPELGRQPHSTSPGPCSGGSQEGDKSPLSRPMCRQRQPTPTSISHLPDPSSRAGVGRCACAESWRGQLPCPTSSTRKPLQSGLAHPGNCNNSRCKSKRGTRHFPQHHNAPQSRTALLGPTARPSAFQEWATGVMALSCNLIVLVI